MLAVAQIDTFRLRSVHEEMLRREVRGKREMGGGREREMGRGKRRRKVQRKGGKKGRKGIETRNREIGKKGRD